MTQPTIKEVIVALHEVGGILLTSKYTQLANRIEAEGIAPPDGHIIVPTCAVRKKPYVPMTDDEITEATQVMKPDLLHEPTLYCWRQVETAVIKRAGLNVANQCAYPDCLDNEDERCPKWLTGKCKRAGQENKHD